MRRHQRIRATISGTSERPRLALFKSNRYLSAQLIDDTSGTTLLSVSTATQAAGTPLEKAQAAGKRLAADAKAKKITKVVFDRGGFLYSGRVKAFADSAREGGLEF